MKCNICNSTDLLRIYQIGVINYQKTVVGAPEPEVLFDIMICTQCGAMKADTDTIKKLNVQGIYTIFKSKEL
jgi:hypothetical protein